MEDQIKRDIEMEEQIRKEFPDVLNKPDFCFGLSFGEINKIPVYFICDQRITHSLIKETLLQKLKEPYFTSHNFKPENILLPTHKPIRTSWAKYQTYIKARLNKKVYLTCKFENKDEMVKPFHIIDEDVIIEYDIASKFHDCDYVIVGSNFQNEQTDFKQQSEFDTVKQIKIMQDHMLTCDGCFTCRTEYNSCPCSECDKDRTLAIEEEKCRIAALKKA